MKNLIEFPGGAAADRQIKTLVFIATTEKAGEGQSNIPVLALVRGDHTLNQAKLTNAVARLVKKDGREVLQTRAAHPEEIVELMGASAGSLGAVGHSKAWIVADETLKGRRNMTTGANVDDQHIRGVSVERDIKVTEWLDIRGVAEGEACPKCDGILRVAKAIEVGHIFKLGTKYSDAMGARVLTSEGKEVPIVMGCYGIGVERILAAAIELHHDEAGIIFPVTIAPFEVVITPLNTKDEQIP